MTNAVYTPHPITLEGQRFETLNVGETVQEFLDRVIGQADHEAIEVRLNDTLVPRDYWSRIRPKPDTLLAVRGTVGKQALYIIAMVALIYFTGGIAAGAMGAAGGIGGVAFGAGTLGALALNAAVFVAGPACGGRVLR